MKKENLYCHRCVHELDLLDEEIINEIYCIVHTKSKDGQNNLYSVGQYGSTVRFLSFKSKQIAEEFLTHFKDLIEKAGDLI